MSEMISNQAYDIQLFRLNYPNSDIPLPFLQTGFIKDFETQAKIT